MSEANADTWSEDAMLGGRIRLRQLLQGYRAGADAALLAAACDAGPGQRVAEIGCGAGAALLAAAVRRPEARFVGVEKHQDSLQLARHNVEANDLQDRIEIVQGSARAPFSGLGLKPFDAVMANPPFFDNPAAIRGPAPAKRAAWIADDGLAIWTAWLVKAVRERGTITLIHRAERLGDILFLLGEKAGSFQVRPVHPFAEAPAKRIIVRAVKTGKAPLQVLPPLIMHAAGGAKHTGEAEAILRGEAALPWN